MNCSRRDIEIQFNRVVKNGWLKWFQENARRAGTTTAHELALGSRETNLQNIRGDFRGGIYHGFGVMQVDIGTDPQYCRNWTPQNVEPSIRRGTDIYLSKVKDTLNCVGKKSIVRTRSFVGEAVQTDDLRRIATAAYNCGRWAHYHFSRGENVDSTTTGHDYSRDVYDRAVEFAELLELKNIEQNCVQTELALQGKYARQEHRKRFNFSPEQARLKLLAGTAQESQDELEKASYERNSFSPPETSSSELDSVPAEPDLTDNINPSVNLSPVPPLSPAVDQPLPGDVPNQPEQNPSQQPSPQGDAPDAPASAWLNVEDWKPWVFSKLKWVWGTFTGGNLTQGATNLFTAVQSGEHWWIPLVIGVSIFIVSLIVCAVISVILLAIWYFNRKEIKEYILFSKKSFLDPGSHNLGLTFEKIGAKPNLIPQS